MILFQGLSAEMDRQATIPSKKVIQKKPVAEVKSVDAGAIPKPPPAPAAGARKATGAAGAANFVDPFSGGTGGAGGQRKTRRDVSIDDGTDDLLTRILTGAGVKDASSGAAADGDFGKTIRQMTEEITKNLGKEGGLEGLGKMLDHPSVRQATEAISKVLTKDGAAAAGGDKAKALREMTQEVMKNIDLEAVMKNFDPEMLKNLNPEMLKGLNPEMMKNFNPDMLKNFNPEMMKNFNPDMLKGLNLDGLFKDLPKGADKKDGKPAADYASILDSFLGNNGGKAKADYSRKPAGNNNSYKKGIYNSYDSTEDDMFDFFGKDDF